MSSKFFDFLTARVLSKAPVKVVVVVIACVIFGIGLYGTIQIEQDYQEDWIIPEGNYFFDYIQMSKKYFPKNGADGYVYFGEIDYLANDDLLLELPEKLAQSPQISLTS